MYIPNLKSNESIYSYAYRLAKLNGYLSKKYFYSYIVERSGKVVNSSKLERELYRLIGSIDRTMFYELLKRKQGIITNHKLNSNIDNDQSFLFDKAEVYENFDKYSFFCPSCMNEQIHYYGHVWLKVEWLYDHYCTT
ncbi:TniQ family protein [Vibrio parahaemolyticus]|uniref:TniQ family protein n=1 Tax=Vibrio parahaemolyticus TaxID=670 RepID=UPI00387B3373